MEILTIKLIIFFIFLFMTSYFAATETALTSLTTLSLKSLRDRFKRYSKFISFWEEKPSEILATVIVGINFAIIGSGVVATSIALDLKDKLSLSTGLVLSVVPIGAALLTLSIGQIIPKIISRYHPDRISALVFPFLIVFHKLFSWVAKFMLKISEVFTKLFNRHSVKEQPFLRHDELKILLLSEDSLPIPVPARRFMENILDFGKIKISQVMVPRTEIQAVNLDQEKDKIIAQIIEKGYSRIPVYRGNLDNIVGIIYSKDLIFARKEGSLFVISDLISPAYFVPESARIDQVLREFKKGHQHMALVVDEFGSTIGLATIEDIVEEIVGDIWDEYDIQEKTILPFPDGSYLLRASESLVGVNEELKLDLPEQEFNTISGWVLDIFGRIPKVGETIKWGNLEIEIVDADRKKVQRVKIKKIK